MNRGARAHLALVVSALVMVGWIVLSVERQADECTGRGGMLLRGPYELECVQVVRR